MPKISIPTTTGDNPRVTATKEQLNQALAKLDYLLSGQIDNDNLLQDRDSGTPFQIPTKTAVDYPDKTRPVDDSMKFFAYQSGEDNFFDNVWSEIHTEFIQNPDLILLTGAQSWSLSKEVLAEIGTYQNTQTSSKNIRKILSSQFIFNKPVVIDKPPNIVPITNTELFEILTNSDVEIEDLDGADTTEAAFRKKHYSNKRASDYVIMPQIVATADYPSGKKPDISIDRNIFFDAENIILDVTLTVDQFDETDFLNFQIILDVLCKVLR